MGIRRFNYIMCIHSRVTTSFKCFGHQYLSILGALDCSKLWLRRRLIMYEHQSSHRRSSSGASLSSNHSRHSRTRSASPSQTFHPPFLPFPTPVLLESVAGAAHYSGSCVNPDAVMKRRHSDPEQLEVHTELKCEHERVLNDLKELYCARPTMEIFHRSWMPDAIFEDPLAKCKGFNEYGPQWFAMPKLFSHSETISTRVMSSTTNPNRLIYEQLQEYTWRFIGIKTKIHSIIIVDLNEDEKIVRLLDQWNGDELRVRYGAAFMRKMNAILLPWFIRTPKWA